MNLPIQPPYLPMELDTASELPSGAGWQFEPKWDGFRCLAFRSDSELELQSKSGQTLGRYFPEVVQALLEFGANRFVLDGELIVPGEGGFSFDYLLQRIHPAESRIKKLSVKHPAKLIVFDLLIDTRGLRIFEKPLRERRKLLEAFAGRYFTGSIHLSRATCDLKEAKSWFGTIAGLDGIVAKRLDCDYRSGLRDCALKIKKLRTADCVIGGFRYSEKAPQVGSLLLGLYGDDGLLHHVGFTSGISAKERPALTKKLEKLIQPPGFSGRAPGGPSRWSTARSTEWQPLSPSLVVEVQYDHFSGGRFRHGTKLLRWRPDKAPSQCTMRQVLLESRSPLHLLALSG